MQAFVSGTPVCHAKSFAATDLSTLFGLLTHQLQTQPLLDLNFYSNQIFYLIGQSEYQQLFKEYQRHVLKQHLQFCGQLLVIELDPLIGLAPCQQNHPLSDYLIL